ncbi:Protein kinase family protein [Rhynchospora pubera]|uniref:Protein kinase family protein n=1 Tax=Rhynchospora pubera TaxID=906938 RepID=A0AAV8DNW2_9POAL|nr:Protein kinase family protein [Rhynchospora pubera]
MGKRLKYGAFLVPLILLLLNYESSSLNFEDGNSQRMLAQQKNIEANVPLKPPKDNTSHSPLPSITGTLPPSNGPRIPENNTTTNSTEATQVPATQTTNVGTASSGNSINWVYFVIIPVVGLLVGSLACMVLVSRKKGVATIRPWRTGLSGPLRHAFVTGVPKLNRVEIEAACEEFSNIVVSYPEYTVFKGTLSSGVEVSVASTTVRSANDWSKTSEMCFRNKIEMLMRINHKNFVNLLGYCEEEVPFTRIMVFEYATNGSLFEHLHVEGNEPLHWHMRMRIIMGIAYYLQHIHELEPSIAHPVLNSSLIFLTEDFAAKVSEDSVWKEVIRKDKALGNENNYYSEEKAVDVKSNIYSFGMLLLEIITGRLPYSDDFFLLNLALECIKETGSITPLLDPALRSHKPHELDVIWEVIQECTRINPQERPKMSEINTKLREVLAICPEIASPRHSPLWWAELEIVSA